MPSAAPSPTVLIFTYSEFGQANVALATAYELALAGADVHIASFAPLESRVSRLQALVVRDASRTSGGSPGSVAFHECTGLPSWSEALIRRGVKDANFSHPHGVLGASECFSMIETIFFPWSPEEHILAIRNCEKIIASVNPDIVAVGLLFEIAHDACQLSCRKFVTLSPNSIKDYAVAMQPYQTALWKYPILASGFPFPLKWWQIPLNTCLYIRLLISLTNSPRINAIDAIRRSIGLKIPSRLQGFGHYNGIKLISPSLTEIEFPFPLIPSPVILCGPIILPFDPLEETDTALTKWLDNGPTALINLGTLVTSDSRVAEELANAIRILLDYHDRRGLSKFQVLWKVKTSEAIRTAIDDIIGRETEQGRVKLLPWLEAEPVSVLQHPNVVCTVHHGGANSFYEGVWSGVPHIVLPVWVDTYEYATRAESLDIGVFGNKSCAPSVRAEEFARAMVRVTGNTEEAARFKRSARDLKDVCRERSGRELAASAILREVGVKQ